MATAKRLRRTFQKLTRKETLSKHIRRVPAARFLLEESGDLSTAVYALAAV